MLWWTLQNLILAALLAGVVALVSRLRIISPATKHALWLVVLVKLLTPPLFVWPWALPVPTGPWDAPGSRQPLLVSAAPSERRTAIVDTPLVDPPPAMQSDVPPADLPLTALDAPAIASTPGPVQLVVQAAEPPHMSLAAWALPTAAAIWIAGAIVFAVLQIVRMSRMSLKLRRATPAAIRVLQEVERMAGRMKVRPVPTHAIGGIGSPFIWAVTRPRLLWPLELPADLPLASLQGLVVHELAHVKRRDHWVGWLELAAGCLWWWNPLYWYVRYQLRENAELACDAWVLGTLPKGRRAYAEALLAVCECLSHASAPLPALAAGTGGRKPLERRLAMILKGKVPLRISPWGLVATILLAATGLPAWSQKPADEPAKVPVILEVVEDVEFGEVIQFLEKQVQPAPIPAVGPRGIGTPGFPGRVTVRARTGPPLPKEASAAIERFEAQAAQLKQEAEQKIEQSRREMLQGLQQLQEQLTKEGRNNEAAALAAYITRQRGSAKTGTTPPEYLVELRGRVGESFVYDVTGAAHGTVWGTDVYTDDSTLSAAAVHAGLLQVGQKGQVRVTIAGGQESYTGSTRNGITSSNYGPWPGSYRVSAATSGPRYRVSAKGEPDPGYLHGYRGRVGQTFSFEVVGTLEGTVWGSDVYTDDSRLAAAAVHSGVVDVGERGTVHVKILPGRGSYDTSTRNGVTSLRYDEWGGSFQFVPGATAYTRSFTAYTRSLRAAAVPDPGTLMEYRDRVGKTFVFDVVGAHEFSTIWGDGVYTDDSSLATAAVHAGVLKSGQRAQIEVTILPAQGSYGSSTKNSVTSNGWGFHGGSYRILGLRAAEAPRRSGTSILRGGTRGTTEATPERRVGDSYEVEVLGSADGIVWGSDVYTSDSSLGTAAVHAGILELGQRGKIRVTVLEGKESYDSTTRHGITSQPYGAWPQSLRIERPLKSGIDRD